MADNRKITPLARELESAIRDYRGGSRAELAGEFRRILAKDVAEVTPGQKPNRFERHFEAQRLGDGELSGVEIRNMNAGAARRTDIEWKQAFAEASDRIGNTLPEDARRLAAEAFHGASNQLTCDALDETNIGQPLAGQTPNLPEFEPGGRCR